METRPPLTLAEQFSAACDWWREAGVDQDFHDHPEALLAEVQSAPDKAPPQVRRKEPEPEPKTPQIGGSADHWPDSLEQFAEWWLQEPLLDARGIGGRVAPRGTKSASLMVLVPMPEAEDRDTLLSAMQGKLVANMLKAMGIPDSEAYLASVLPRHMPLADWGALQAEGLGNVLLHHIQLAAPHRLLVLGRDILPLLGQEKRQGVRELPLNGGAIQLLASYTPDNLLGNARLRADLWRRWLDWTENT